MACVDQNTKRFSETEKKKDISSILPNAGETCGNSDPSPGADDDLAFMSFGSDDSAPIHEFSTRLLEKRKVHGGSDEDVVQAKRMHQLENMSSSEEEASDELGIKEDPLTSSINYILGGISPNEIAELREKLGDGYFQNYFSLMFWKNLHSNYGSILGYTLGFLVILMLNYQWMLEEFADSTEGHSVAKTFVTLFVIYSYSFITLGLECVQLSLLIMELYFSNAFKRFQESFNKTVEKYGTLKKWRASKYFFTPVVIIWCVVTAVTGSALWRWFWWNHICKSYHDRTCRGSWLGQLVIKYRDDACYDGTASSMMCERFVSYLPIMLFSVFLVFLGNVFMPLLNGWLSAYYPISENLEAAFDIIDRLKDESTMKSSENVESTTMEDNCSDKDETPESQGVLRKMIPTALGVLILLLIDWAIVKKYFPK